MIAEFVFIMSVVVYHDGKVEGIHSIRVPMVSMGQCEKKRQEIIRVKTREWLDKEGYILRCVPAGKEDKDGTR